MYGDNIVSQCLSLFKLIRILFTKYNMYAPVIGFPQIIFKYLQLGGGKISIVIPFPSSNNF